MIESPSSPRKRDRKIAAAYHHKNTRSKVKALAVQSNHHQNNKPVGEDQEQCLSPGATTSGGRKLAMAVDPYQVEMSVSATNSFSNSITELARTTLSPMAEQRVQPPAREKSFNRNRYRHLYHNTSKGAATSPTKLATSIKPISPNPSPQRTRSTTKAATSLSPSSPRHKSATATKATPVSPRRPMAKVATPVSPRLVTTAVAPQVTVSPRRSSSPTKNTKKAATTVPSRRSKTHPKVVKPTATKQEPPQQQSPPPQGPVDPPTSSISAAKARKAKVVAKAIMSSPTASPARNNSANNNSSNNKKVAKPVSPAATATTTTDVTTSADPPPLQPSRSKDSHTTFSTTTWHDERLMKSLNHSMTFQRRLEEQAAEAIRKAEEKTMKEYEKKLNNTLKTIEAIEKRKRNDLRLVDLRKKAEMEKFEEELAKEAFEEEMKQLKQLQDRMKASVLNMKSANTNLEQDCRDLANQNKQLQAEIESQERVKQEVNQHGEIVSQLNNIHQVFQEAHRTAVADLSRLEDDCKKETKERKKTQKWIRSLIKLMDDRCNQPKLLTRIHRINNRAKEQRELVINLRRARQRSSKRSQQSGRSSVLRRKVSDMRKQAREQTQILEDRASLTAALAKKREQEEEHERERQERHHQVDSSRQEHERTHEKQERQDREQERKGPVRQDRQDDDRARHQREEKERHEHELEGRLAKEQIQRLERERAQLLEQEKQQRLEQERAERHKMERRERHREEQERVTKEQERQKQEDLEWLEEELQKEFEDENADVRLEMDAAAHREMEEAVEARDRAELEKKAARTTKRMNKRRKDIEEIVNEMRSLDVKAPPPVAVFNVED